MRSDSSRVRPSPLAELSNLPLLGFVPISLAGLARWIVYPLSSRCLKASSPHPSVDGCSDPKQPRFKSCSTPVVLHHLDGFLRFKVAGLLRPAPDRRVSCVFPLSVLSIVRRRDGGASNKRPRKILPLEVFPRLQRVSKSPWPPPSSPLSHGMFAKPVAKPYNHPTFSQSRGLTPLSGT